jgi:7,8-dihydro-6-hydroxymethylpterin dimethyltransferase
MSDRNNDYYFLEHTISLCPLFLNRVDAKIINKNGIVYLKKYCREHGEQIEILEEDYDYYSKRMLFDKPATKSKKQTSINNLCPNDCGLCPDHEQHSCNSLIEVTNKCDLYCPVCYANSGDDKTLSLTEIDKMLDFLIDSEYGSSEILQISGGEPCIHPDIIEIIKNARTKNIKYILLNTNGIRIAEDEEFVKQLSQFKGGFEIYLQFDGFDEKTYSYFRGKNLNSIKQKAIDNLAKYNIPITLVATVERNINDKEIGKTILFGLEAKNIRGINFQPVAYFGRGKNTDTSKRITITGIIDKIEKQTNGMIKKTDFIPLPCNVDRVAITYLYKENGGFIPLMRNLNIKDYLPAIRNTFKFDPSDLYSDMAKSIFSANSECCNYLGLIKNMKKIIPFNYIFKNEQEKINYVSENTFRISITSFLDAYNFDIKSIKKECVHIITPDLEKIPFSTYNILYRNK